MQSLIVTAVQEHVLFASWRHLCRTHTAFQRLCAILCGAAIEKLRFSTDCAQHMHTSVMIMALPSNCKCLFSRWRDHGDDDGDVFCQNVWFVESLALELSLRLRPQAEATILTIGLVGSGCDNSKDTVQTLVEKRGEEIRIAKKVHRMNHVEEFVVLPFVGNAAKLRVLVLLRSVMDFLLDGEC